MPAPVPRGHPLRRLLSERSGRIGGASARGARADAPFSLLCALGDLGVKKPG